MKQMEPRHIVRFASSHRSLVHIVKSGKMKDETADGLTVPGERVQFRDYKYETEDPKEIESLMARAKQPGSAVRITYIGEEYQCMYPDCGASFPTKQQYDSHKSVHTKEEKKKAG